MLDFLKISERTRKGVTEVYPKFMIQKTKDLMIRGGDFYAIWIEERGLWSTDENDAIQLIDKALKEHFEKKNMKSLDLTNKQMNYQKNNYHLVKITLY